MKNKLVSFSEGKGGDSENGGNWGGQAEARLRLEEFVSSSFDWISEFVSSSLDYISEFLGFSNEWLELSTARDFSDRL